MEKRKVLAVFGSPASGKTTTAIKIASELSKHKKNVIIVTLDPYCPVIPYILPSTASHDISLGELLSKPTVSQTEILDACVPLENNEYISVLGYKLGESLCNYPKVIASNVTQFFINLKHLSDYLIIDCSTVIENDVSTIVALQFADVTLKLGTSDLKGISYFYTVDRLLENSKYDKNKQITAISNLKVGQEWESVSSELGVTKFVIPNCPLVEIQSQELNLFNNSTRDTNNLYNLEIKKIVEYIFSLKVGNKINKNNLNLFNNEKNDNIKKDNIKKVKKKKFKFIFNKEKGEF